MVETSKNAKFKEIKIHVLIEFDHFNIDTVKTVIKNCQISGKRENYYFVSLELSVLIKKKNNIKSMFGVSDI